MKLKPTPFPTCVSLLLGLTPSLPFAQGVAAPVAAPHPPAAQPSLLNAWLLKQNDAFSAFDIGGQVRARYEVKENGGSSGSWANADFRHAGAPNDNSFLLLRERIHLGYHCSWVGAYVEGRDASSTGDSRDPNPEADRLDLHQAWVTLGNPRELPWSLKVGRQELVYGDERLIGNGDWGNLARSFDTAKLRFEKEKIWVDAFAGRMVLADDGNFNTSNDYDLFSGIYASTRSLVSHLESQLYFLSRNTSLASSTAQTGSLIPLPAARDIYTLGVRAKSLPGTLAGWDYGLELAGQLGNIKAGGAATERLEHRAYAASAGGGYTLKDWSMAPRFGLEYNFASGDKDPNDHRSGTFEQLFPTNHKHYGAMDFVGWKNLHEVRLLSTAKPLKKLQVSLDYHLFWLANANDAFYTEAGAKRTGAYGINPQYGQFLGSEIDLDATYTVTRYAALRAGYGHFFTGSYIDETLANAGGSRDADWIYAQLTLNF